MVIAMLLTGWQIFASVLWIAPSSALRQLVPGNLLSSYMLPMFGQSWSVFAPEPINGNFTLQVRALLKRGVGQEVTSWVDATKVELSMIKRNPFPPRAGIQSTELAMKFKSSWDALDSESRESVALDYVQDQTPRQTLSEKLAASNQAAGLYLATEDLLRSYSTQVAKAIWGESVAQVQFEVSRQNIVPFADRNKQKATPQPVQKAVVGWRDLMVIPGQSEPEFSEVFREAYLGLEK